MAHLSVTAREWCLDLGGLTARECQILQTLSNGKPQKHCAAELGISPRTYEKQVDSLRRKLGVTRTWEILPAVVARTRASFGT
ncbi:MAG: helix-turn-helix transcriptional regulator [Blastocatellia bacterium]|nr:helix-turn-helix transcriptional regulator [Blastocatellia bacterium]